MGGKRTSLSKTVAILDGSARDPIRDPPSSGEVLPILDSV